MSDLISRDEAIKAIKKRMGNKPLPPTEIYTYFECIDEIKTLPSAETHDKRTETHSVCSDLIRRSDAIEAIFKVGHEHVEEKVIPLGAVTDYSDAIKSLPSADITETETCQRCQDLTDTILNRQGDEIKRLKAEARPTGEWI